MMKSLFPTFIALMSLVMNQGAFATPKTDLDAHFLSMTDIHFDPFLSCKNDATCVKDLNAKTSDQWTDVFIQHAAPQAYGTDTSYTLLESALNDAQLEAKTAHVKFVVLLGDFLGHNFKKNYQTYTGDMTPEGYQAFVKKTFQFLNAEVSRTFPTTDVYSIIGNNDSYQDDYVSDHQQGVFYTDMAAMWSSLIQDKNNRTAMQQGFKVQGYYAVDVANLHIILMNSSLFSTRAAGAQDGDAEAELKWINNELDVAAQKHEKALIVSHIPIGIDSYATISKAVTTTFWIPKFTDSFQAILQAHSANIVGMLSAHTHADWFQVLSNGYANAIPVSFTSSISPANGNNPGFKIYSFNDQALTDFVTHFYNIADNKGWSREYDFNDIYQQDCSNCQLVNGMNKLAISGDLTENYKKLYGVSTDSQPITKGKWNPYYWCAIRSMTVADYQACADSSK